MQDVPNIKDLLLNENCTLKEALALIDKNAQGLCFITGNLGVLAGVLTDGDIRRGILKGASLETRAGDLMQSNFISFPVGTNQELIYKKLSHEIRHIPLVDDQNRPVDYACFSRTHRTPIMQPQLNGNELAYLSDCIQTGWISSQGAYVKRFEREFSAFCEAQHPVAVSNGTVALHLALVALGIKAGDEVIVPNLTFAASINSIIYTGAIPVIADVERDTWTLSIEEVKNKITSKTKAIMPVHLYGQPCRMDEIMAVANENNLFVIEDAAEAIGGFYKGKHVGTFGDAATFSFFGNKTITTGEGGMIFFKDKKHFDRAVVLRDHGMSKEKKYWHDEVGFNYRMTNMQAAIGCAQLERIRDFISEKRKLAAFYDRLLENLEAFEIPPNPDWSQNGYWLYTALLKKNAPFSRNTLIEKMLKNGIETRPAFYPLHAMPPYQQFGKSGTFPVSELISEQGISFPSSVHLSNSELENMSQTLTSIFHKHPNPSA